MAAITRLMTTLDAGTANTNWVDSSGAGVGNANTDTGPPGTAPASVSDKVSKSIEGLLYDSGGTTTFAVGDHVTIWYNLLFGALDTLAGEGVRFRVTGATATDWAEVVVDGADSGKSGWQFLVVSLDAVLANPTASNGTPPTTAASIQRCGIIWDITATVGGNNDNVAVGAVHRIPTGTAAFRIEGDSGSAIVDWDTIATDITADAGRGVVLKNSNGTFTINAPLEVGDTTAATDDTNLQDSGSVLAWNNQEYVENDFFGIEVKANATDSVSVNAGSKLGSGETAVGVGGWSIITGGPRWFIEAEDANMNALNLYGCSFTGSSTWSIDDDAVEAISCVFTDCDTILMTGGATGPTILSNFFSSAPGPQAQIVFTSGATPTNGQFDFNTFANMKWFAIEIPNETLQFDLRGVGFAGNGTDRDVLLSHITNIGTPTAGITLNVLEGGDTPGVTNGATITVTMVGAVDVLMVTAGTWAEAQGTETDDLGAQGVPLVTQTTASLTVDDDTFALSAAVPGARTDLIGGFDTITYTGTSDQYEDSNVASVPSEGGGLVVRQGADEVTFAAATRTGFPVHALTETEGVQGIVHVDAAAPATPVVNLDSLTENSNPQMRPWQVAEGVTSLTFSYGAGDNLDNARFLYVGVVALDGTAANTAVSTIVLNHTGGTQALTSRGTSFPQQDDNVGATGRSLELSIWDLDVDATVDLDQGAFTVNNNVTVTVTGATEGARITMEADAGGDLAAGTPIGNFPSTAGATGEVADSHSYTNPQPVIYRGRYSGAPLAAVELNATGADAGTFTDYTTEANNSTASNVNLLPATQAVDDAFYIGMLQPWTKLSINIATAGTHTGFTGAQWEYWNGSAWTALTGVTDGSDQFRNSGRNTVTWTEPGNWTAVNRSASGSPTTTPLYFVRFTLGTVAGTSGTRPLGTRMSGNPTRYLPFQGSATIESTGLTAGVVWIEDTITT